MPLIHIFRIVESARKGASGSLALRMGSVGPKNWASNHSNISDCQPPKHKTYQKPPQPIPQNLQSTQHKLHHQHVYSFSGTHLSHQSSFLASQRQ